MQNRIKLMTLLVTVFAGNFYLQAQTTPEEIINKFFDIYKDAPLEAVDYIFGTNVWMIEHNKEGTDKLKAQLSASLELIGEYYGYEKITERSVGGSYKLMSYMIKCDRQPIRFTFIFYKPKDVWRVQNFQYDDDLGDELEEAAKVHRLKENKD